MCACLSSFSTPHREYWLGASIGEEEEIDTQAAAPREGGRALRKNQREERKGEEREGQRGESEKEGRTGGSCHVHECMYL